MKVFEFHLYSNDELLLEWIERHFDLDVGQPICQSLKVLIRFWIGRVQGRERGLSRFRTAKTSASHGNLVESKLTVMLG